MYFASLARQQLKSAPRASKQGFTLIELLVVIAIISILAAILFPVFWARQENARRSSCQSNLKQIGLGIMQYTQDFDETYPFAHNLSDADGVTWRQGIQPYLKSTQIFACPSNRQNAQDRDAATGNYPAIPESYAGNFRIFRLRAIWAGPEDANIAPVPLAKIQNSAQKIMVTEVHNQGFASAGAMWPDWSNGGKDADMKFFFPVLHLSTSNYLFADGHVKAMRPAQTMTGVNMWGGFNDNSGSGECPTAGEAAWTAINCDEISSGARTNLALLQASTG